jgi:hypothetical protein
MILADILDGVVLFFMLAIWLSACSQRNYTRLIVASVFTAAVLIHDIIFHTFLDSAFYYYITAVLLGLFVILTIEKMQTHTHLSGQIQIICLISMVLNLFGFYDLMKGAEPNAYMLSYILLYAWTLYVLNTGEPEYGRYEMDTRLSTFLPGNTASRSIHTSD